MNTQQTKPTPHEVEQAWNEAVEELEEIVASIINPMIEKLQQLVDELNKVRRG